MDKNVQYILEVAKCGGITKAANNLYITPSALSKFVQAREEELNVQLFHRIGKRFVLTAAGGIMWADVRRSKQSRKRSQFRWSGFPV